jgi:hypothetical protein
MNNKGLAFLEIIVTLSSVITMFCLYYTISMLIGF